MTIGPQFYYQQNDKSELSKLIKYCQDLNKRNAYATTINLINQYKENNIKNISFVEVYLEAKIRSDIYINNDIDIQKFIEMVPFSNSLKILYFDYFCTKGDFYQLFTLVWESFQAECSLEVNEYFQNSLLQLQDKSLEFRKILNALNSPSSASPFDRIILSFSGWMNESSINVGQENLIASVTEGNSDCNKHTRCSLLIDSIWYQKHYRLPDSENAENHYLSYGHKNNYMPNPFFDPTALVYDRSGINAEISPLQFFCQSARQLNYFPHPAWCEEEYIHSNAAVRDAINSGIVESGYEYFCRFGHKQVLSDEWHRLTLQVNEIKFDFNEEIYLSSNSEAYAAVKSGLVSSGLEFFFLHGHKQSIMKSLFPLNKDNYPTLRETIQGKNLINKAKCLVLFSHFDAYGRVDEYVYEYLSWMKSNNMEIVFISSLVCDDDLLRLRDFCSTIFIKNDVGRDFGSWYLAIESLRSCLDSYQWVILANDSVYWLPDFDFPIIDWADRTGLDVWGLCDSMQGGKYHIQSWFIALNRRSRQFYFQRLCKLWRDQTFFTKAGLICDFEIGLSLECALSGLKLGAFCSIHSVYKKATEQSFAGKISFNATNFGINLCNPTHKFWNILIEDFGLPAIKVELLRDNPEKNQNLHELDSLINDRCLEIIMRHQIKYYGNKSKYLSARIDSQH